MQENWITVTRTARYYTLGEFSDQTKTIWIVCHGYAHLARDFIQEFETLVNNQTVIVAPEALSRFYTKGFFGKVGATWMTKEDRFNEISDYADYLQQLYNEIKEKVSEDAKFQILGFSQGVATTCRWVTMKKPDFENLWICSGEIPPDTDWKSFQAISRERKIIIVYGLNDPFPLAWKKDITALTSLIEQHEINYHISSFEGGHEINADLLKQLYESVKQQHQ